MKRLARNLTFQVLCAVALGALVGAIDPGLGRAMRPVGDTFVKLVKMVIGPIIFLTIVLGISNIADLKKVGRVGGKALLYFEIVTTFALAIGLVVVNLTRPGSGLAATNIAAGDASNYTAQGKSLTFTEFLTHIVPSSAVEAFAQGDILQIVFFSVLFGVALTALGESGRPLAEVLDTTLHVFFRIVALVMKVAPIGAFGAMAFTVGNFGLRTLLPLGRLMLDVYLTMFLFIFVVLNLIARAYGFSLWTFLKYISEEILIVLGTSSSEAALPGMLEKLERYGCARSVVGLVIPTGYSFNLDGTSIYLSMATVFLAQVYDVDLSLRQQLGILAVLMVTSKGAAGVTGSGFIVLASTLQAMKVVPVEGIALLLGVDRFMS
ncbi:MAG TPA: C4-dicarboxylate transporter DctA, partial [Vicinamibacteria bacterium]|nr:C4-dicarboxylate transporter DctA [Vicinamibacteria bacterium]